MDLTELAERESTRDLSNHFKRRFVERYGHAPVLTSDDDATFAWLLDQCGNTKSMMIVDLYLKSNDKFFLEKGHAPKFIRNNVNTFITKIDAAKAIPKPSRAIIIRANLFCSNCSAVFDWAGSPSDIEGRHQCQACQNSRVKK